MRRALLANHTACHELFFVQQRNGHCMFFPLIHRAGHCFAPTAFCPATGFIKIHIIIHGSAHRASYIFFFHSITSQKNAKQTQFHTETTPKGCYSWIWFDYTPTLWRCQLRICRYFGDFLLISYIFYTIIELPDHKGVFLLWKRKPRSPKCT